LGISTGTFFSSVGLFIIGKKIKFELPGDDQGKAVEEELRSRN
jgi:hypothetical protein